MPIDNSTRFPKPLAADLRELSEGMAIVIDGDTAPKAIASGQYLFIKNHSTLATGGYHATAAIASGADVTSSNVTPDADGIVNGAFSSLSEQMVKHQSNINLTQTGTEYILYSGFHSLIYRVGNIVTLYCNLNATNNMPAYTFFGALPSSDFIPPEDVIAPVQIYKTTTEAESNTAIINKYGNICFAYAITSGRDTFFSATYIV